MLNVFFIAVILVCITDISGFWDSVEAGVSRWLKCKIALPKILVCSFCQTHWIGLIYMIIAGIFSLQNYALLLLICISTPLISNVIYNIKDILGIIINIPMTFLK